MTQLAEKLHPWVASGRPAGGPRWLQDLRETENENYFRIKHICVPFPTRDAGKEELYDLAEDPLEHRDLGADPAYASIRARLRAGAAAWWLASGGEPLSLVH